MKHVVLLLKECGLKIQNFGDENKFSDRYEVFHFGGKYLEIPSMKFKRSKFFAILNPI